MNSARLRAHSGTTLIELLIVLALIGLLTSVVTLSMRRTPSPSPADPYEAIAVARRMTIAHAVPATIVVVSAGRRVPVALYPDGRVLTDSALHLDPLTGRRRSDVP